MWDMEELAALQDMDVRAVDPESLADINEVHINMDLPREERIAETIRQMKGNPYFFRCGDIVVKMSFQGTASLQELLEDCLGDPEICAP